MRKSPHRKRVKDSSEEYWHSFLSHPNAGNEKITQPQNRYRAPRPAAWTRN